MKIKHKYTGSSLLELKEKFGTGKKGFWDNSWWLKEFFADEKPEVGEYEIEVSNDLADMTYDEQLRKLDKDFTPTHPAILAEAILVHYEKTGEKLAEDYYLRTSSLDSDGFRVYVGVFVAKGLSVSYYRYDDVGRLDFLGLSGARKLTSKTGTLDPFDAALTLEAAIKKCKEEGLTVTKIY